MIKKKKRVDTKAVITIRDEAGSVSVSADFDPPLDVTGDAEATPAQVAALTALEAIRELAGGGPVMSYGDEEDE